MYTCIITSHFKKSNEKCKILINNYKTKLVNNITKSSLKILPPPKKIQYWQCDIYQLAYFSIIFEQYNTKQALTYKI